MTSETAISRWLQTEMPQRGYPLGGPRAGGISRLAEDAGIPQATMSRLVNGRAEPGIESLRKLATLWKVPLGEMLVHAGYADLNDLHVIVAPADADHDAPHVSLPAHVSLSDLEPWERDIWLSPHLTTPEKEVTILVIRLRRGELNDYEGIGRLYYALGKMMERRMEPSDPLRAV